MKDEVVAVCAVAAILGLISAGLGFAAEGTKVQGSDITVDVSNNVCTYPSSPASLLGYISALVLLVDFIFIHSASKCICCHTRPREQQPPVSSCRCGPALVFFIFSWLTFVPGFLLMLGAATLSRNSNMASDDDYSGFSYSYSCYYLKNGVFAAAAGLSLISIVLGIISHASLNSGPRRVPAAAAYDAGNIAMAQPRVPPPPPPATNPPIPVYEAPPPATNRPIPNYEAPPPATNRRIPVYAA